MTKTRVLIADDHPMIQIGVKNIVESEPGFEVVGTSPNAPISMIADERRPVGLVFGDTGSAPAVARATKRIMLCVVRVPGIPEISVEEALWTSAGILTDDDRGKKAR